MGTYQVRFYNDLVNDQGRCCKVLQRAVRVENARDAVDAGREAERRFEELEGVPDWRLRARIVEVQRLDDDGHSADAGLAARGPVDVAGGGCNAPEPAARILG